MHFCYDLISLVEIHVWSAPVVLTIFSHVNYLLLQDWPIDGVTSPLCKLCGLPPPLIIQVYAPLENSPYHRTLYLFGCLNPNCWNQNERYGPA